MAHNIHCDYSSVLLETNNIHADIIYTYGEVGVEVEEDDLTVQPLNLPTQPKDSQGGSTNAG